MDLKEAAAILNGPRVDEALATLIDNLPDGDARQILSSARDSSQAIQETLRYAQYMIWAHLPDDENQALRAIEHRQRLERISDALAATEGAN